MVPEFDGRDADYFRAHQRNLAASGVYLHLVHLGEFTAEVTIEQVGELDYPIPPAELRAYVQGIFRQLPYAVLTTVITAPPPR